VRWNFNAANPFAQCDRTLICGSEGSALSSGPTSSEQTVTYTTARGTASPRLEGSWFVNGFQGTMGELLCAIEQKREPFNSAENNRATLELAFAALASATSGRSVAPGDCRRLSGELLAQCRPTTASGAVNK
jgi:predicted dehydrogenase